MQADFRFTCAPPLARLSVTGELDLSTRDRLVDILACLRHRGCTRVEVDLSAITFIDASSLAVLHAEQLRLLLAGGSLEVVAASPTHQLVCRVARYDGLLPSGPPTSWGRRAVRRTGGLPTLRRAGRARPR